MGSRSKVNVSTAMAIATAHAVRLLQDPETRAQLIRVGSDATRQIRGWYQERSGPTQFDSDSRIDDVIDEDGRSVRLVPSRSVRIRRPSALFAQERLERRTVKLAETLDVMRGSIQGNSEALDGVDEAIMRIHLALKVASNLPLAKRARAHHEISQTLGALEKAVMSAVLRDDAAR